MKRQITVQIRQRMRDANGLPKKDAAGRALYKTVDALVQIDINTASLLKEVATNAARNAGGRATAVRGFIRARVIERGAKSHASKGQA
jgi:hypothetical protein